VSLKAALNAYSDLGQIYSDGADVGVTYGATTVLSLLAAVQLRLGGIEDAMASAAFAKAIAGQHVQAALPDCARLEIHARASEQLGDAALEKGRLSEAQERYSTLLEERKSLTEMRYCMEHISGVYPRVLAKLGKTYALADMPGASKQLLALSEGFHVNDPDPRTR
jgi:hypothetical protein